MEKNPMVTIVIPVYNGSKYVKEAIDSALDQTYKNIEIIVVNDGSNDNGKTESIIKKYENKIKYFSKKNGGVSTALNLAIKNMKGEYFSWLSHDDVYERDKIEKQIEYLRKLNNDDIILYSDYKLINEKSNLISVCKKNSEELNSKPLYSILRGAINGITLLIPKKAFDVCGKFDETKRCTQDYELWWKMLKKYKFVHMPIITAKSRYHMSQESNTNPLVLEEGNPMWIGFLEDLTEKEMISLDRTVYNFYKNMQKFFKDTPYAIPYKYCENKCNEIYKNFKLNNNLVSIIIPFYNRKNIVIKAINSVLNQTYNNIEIIVVNDGSTDDISKIKDICEKNNITLIDIEKNSGVANARNIGLKAAKGEYIAFLDSDDEFLKNKIEMQLKEMVLTGSIISHTSYYRNDDKEGKKIINSGLQSGNILEELIYSCGIATPTVMLKKSYIIKNKIYFDKEKTIGEDICFWINICKNNSLLGIDKPLTIVNTNKDSSAYNNEKQIIGYKTILKYVLNDEFISNKYNNSCARLAMMYAKTSIGNKIVIEDSNQYKKILESKSMKITKPLRLIAKTMRIIREKGLFNYIKLKRIKKK